MQSATAANEKSSKRKRETDEGDYETNIRSFPFLYVLLSTSREGFIDTNVMLSSILNFLYLAKYEDAVSFADLLLIVVLFSLIMIALITSGLSPQYRDLAQSGTVCTATICYEQESPTGQLMDLFSSVPFLQLLLRQQKQMTPLAPSASEIC
jgi:ABC-type polysaccharide/polyol phosphate export permease